MTITFGNVLQIVVTLGGLFMAWANLRQDLAIIKSQIGPLVDWWNRRAARRQDDEAE